MSLQIDLSGRVVAVTGVSDGGLGEGIARMFAAAGADVALFYRSARGFTESLAAELGAHGIRCSAHGGDLGDETRVRAMVGEVLDQLGRIDHLVNNAGLQPVTQLEEMSVAQWDEVVGFNTRSTFLVSQAAGRHMPPGSSITHIASIEGHRMAVGHSHYSASKAAVLMHARAAAVEYGPLGIRVNSVSPGLIDRPGLAQAWPEGVSRWTAASPSGRLGTAADVANACVFLASPMADWITGTDLIVDGGVTARPGW